MIRRLAIDLTDIYKGFVSPRKGFNCAYRIVHGGDSCSSKIRAVISDEPMCEWISGILSQFHACSLAQKLQESEKEKENDKKKRNGPVDAACAAAECGSCAWFTFS